MSQPVLFLDRDGTINIDMGPEYLNSAADTKLIPGAGEAIAKAAQEGFKIAIITNQAGVAKGVTPKEALPEIHKKLEELIRAESGMKDFKFDDIQVCMHQPKDKCSCRKPETGLLEASIHKLKADISKSFAWETS